MKTYTPKPADAVKKWHVVDAEGKVVGRLASQIAIILMGKNKPTFTRSMDMGDFVVVVNAEKVKFTGAKMDDKLYYNYSGYPGGLKRMSARQLLSHKPEDVISRAVKNMLPKNKMGLKLITKLKVYEGKEHPHMAQNPETRELKA